jgi:hypothetical protein
MIIRRKGGGRGRGGARPSSGPVAGASAPRPNVPTEEFPKPRPHVLVTVSPATATVEAGGTQQFVAEVRHARDESVIWSVEGDGAIDAAGLYTAPGAAGSATVRATSAADSAATGQAAVTVEASGPAILWSYDPSADALSEWYAVDDWEPESGMVDLVADTAFGGTQALRLRDEGNSGDGPWAAYKRDLSLDMAGVVGLRAPFRVVSEGAGFALELRLTEAGGQLHLAQLHTGGAPVPNHVQLQLTPQDGGFSVGDTATFDPLGTGPHVAELLYRGDLAAPTLTLYLDGDELLTMTDVASGPNTLGTWNRASVAISSPSADGGGVAETHVGEITIADGLQGV